MKILDIGANDGWWYKNTQGQFPGAQYTLVEANPYNEPALKALGVPYYIACLSDCIKQVTFYTSNSAPTSTGASYYRENTEYFSEDNLKPLQLTTTTLDILFPFETFNYIKMDVQGAEVDIINGGRTLIDRADKVLLEVPMEGVEYNLGAPDRETYFKVMAELGFTKHVIVEIVGNLQEDILFTR